MLDRDLVFRPKVAGLFHVVLFLGFIILHLFFSNNLSSQGKGSENTLKSANETLSVFSCTKVLYHIVKLYELVLPDWLIHLERLYF